jgi:hypothetical protein
MIRLPNHVDEHAAMREALAKLEYSARPVDAAPREPLSFPERRERRKPEEESPSWAWALAGLACLVGSAAVSVGLILTLAMRLGADEQAYLIQVLLGAPASCPTTTGS